MNNTRLINLNCSVIAFTLLFSVTASAEKSHRQKYEDALGKQMEVKCLVEYRGGGEEVRLVVGSFNHPNQAMKLLHGKTFTKQGVQKNIYKVKECVEAKGAFSTSKARQLDKPLLM